MPAVTLFQDQVGDATSTVVGRVRPILGNTKIERILVKGYGTWTDTTAATFLVSDDNANYQALTDAWGYTIGRYGDDFASLLDVPSGTYFKVQIANSGSPAGSLTIKVIGDVVEV